MRRLMAVVFALWLVPAQAAVYRCQQGETTVFADKPCDAAAQPYQSAQPAIIVPHTQAPDLAQQFDRRLAREKRDKSKDEAAWNRDYAKRRQTESRLESARRSRKAAEGMSAHEVRRLLGEPDETRHDEDGQHVRERWTYIEKGQRTQVFLKDDVVTGTSRSKARR